MMNKIILSAFAVLFSTVAFTQEKRITDNNTIGWFVYTGTFKVKPRLAIHTEYQWRRDNAVTNWQQGLFRTGINYSLHKDVNIIVGYAHAQTFSYGDYPAAFAFPEHRIFEQAIIKNPVGKVNLSHRFTFEQRFVGKVTMPAGRKTTNYSYMNRVRYRFRAEVPVYKNNLSFILQDEVFVGWGKNVGANVFDQNRINLLLGYKLNDMVKLEAGYINQALQQASRVNNNPVFQNNNGFVLAANLSLNLIN